MCTADGQPPFRGWSASFDQRSSAMGLRRFDVYTKIIKSSLFFVELVRWRSQARADHTLLPAYTYL